MIDQIYYKINNVFFPRRFPERQAIIEAKKYFGGHPIVACEIGTFKGDHALQMLKHLNIKKLYLVDPYERYEDERDVKSQEFLKNVKEKAHNKLKDYSDIIVWIEKFSEDAAKDMQKDSLDFVYIDGNHKYKYAHNDIRDYLPLVKGEGMISGHDYSKRKFPGVVGAVNDFFEKQDIIYGHHTDWVVIEPNSKKS